MTAALRSMSGAPFQAMPVRAGIGLRAAHYQELLATLPTVGWLEVHSENYFGVGGRPLNVLERARTHYPLSLHGVGLSLGSADPLSERHLQALKTLAARCEPALVSEHLSWSSVDGRYVNDLLPLPYTEEALTHLVSRVQQTQEYLGRQILIENPSSYLQFTHSTLSEWEFLTELSRRSGCGLLLDVNNVYVSARNHGFDPYAYIATLPAERVQEIHLAGFTVNQFEDGELLIDTHDHPVYPEVWALYRWTVARLGPRPTLIEWDSHLPPLATLLAEAAQADSLLDEVRYARAA
ncbi:MAG: DUF692 domain-containing protein [Candidatus Competibacteraceae bacterium]